MFLNRFSQNLQTPIYKRFTAINNVLPAVSPVSFSQPYWKISHSHVATDDSEKSLTFHSPIPDIDKFWTQWFQVESLWKPSWKCDSRSINTYVTWSLHCLKEHLLYNYKCKLFSRVCCISRWGRLKGIYVCREDFVVCSYTTKLQRSLRAY